MHCVTLNKSGAAVLTMNSCEIYFPWCFIILIRWSNSHPLFAFGLHCTRKVLRCLKIKQLYTWLE